MSKTIRKHLSWSLVSYIVMTVVMIGVMALSWQGLAGFGTEQLRLGSLGYLLPLSLDGMTIMFLVMSVSSTTAGESAAGARFLVYVYALMSALFNGEHAHQKYDSLWAVGFYSGLSVSVALALHWTLKHVRRNKLKRQGVTERPLAHFRAVRWVRFPRRTFQAWSLALEFGISKPTEAWDRMLQERTTLDRIQPERPAVQSSRPAIQSSRPVRALPVRSETETVQLDLDESDRARLNKMSKTARVRWIVQKGVRPDAQLIRRTLASLGYDVSRATIYEALRGQKAA
jgi:hypothetical protein